MTTATSAKKKPALLINRNFAFLWSGQAISIIGDSIFDITLVLWIATQIARGPPWAPLAVSGVLLAASMPVFIVGPVAGVFVDRWDKRLTMLRMNVIQAVLVLLLLLMTGIVPLPLITISRLPMNWQLGTIYIIVFLISICYQFVGPSYIALVGDIVDEPQRARATGLGQMVSSIATIVGPPLGTLLFFAVGVQWAVLATWDIRSKSAPIMTLSTPFLRHSCIRQIVIRFLA